jgi:hypothetical protein
LTNSINFDIMKIQEGVSLVAPLLNVF